MLEAKKERAQAQSVEQEAKRHQKAAAYHRAFVQSEAGKSVLDDWVRRYCMKPIGKNDVGLYEAGIAEGRRLLIDEILQNISFIDSEG